VPAGGAFLLPVLDGRLYLRSAHPCRSSVGGRRALGAVTMHTSYVVGNRVIVGRSAHRVVSCRQRPRRARAAVRVVGQRQASRFLGEHLADRAVRFVWTAPVGGRAVAPASSLGIEVIKIWEAAAGKEAIADTHVADGALDATRLIAASDRHRAIMPGKAQQGRMEADLIATSVRHHAQQLQIRLWVRQAAHRNSRADPLHGVRAAGCRGTAATPRRVRLRTSRSASSLPTTRRRLSSNRGPASPPALPGVRCHPNQFRHSASDMRGSAQPSTRVACMRVNRVGGSPVNRFSFIASIS
jgi:hypothetical protein